MPTNLQEFPPEFCSSLDACKKILRSAPQCRAPKARWRFLAAGPLAIYIYICMYRCMYMYIRRPLVGHQAAKVSLHLASW